MFKDVKLVNIFTCGEKFSEFIEISLTRSNQFETINYCSSLVRHDFYGWNI